MDKNNALNKPYLSKLKNISKPKYLLFIALAIFFMFGFHHLSDFISADEHFWLPNSGQERIQDYWKAIGKQDWKATRINDKPGITLAYASGVALLFDNAKGQIIRSDGTIKQFDPARTEQINFLYRLPILLISGFFSLFFFWIIKKITGSDWIALFSATGMLLSPVLLGMSQIVNPDSLFWIFASASLFSFYAFLLRGGKKLAILATIFLGLALASKYVSVILFPFFLFMMAAYYFFEFAQWKHKPEEFAKMVFKNGLAYVGVLAGGMLIFALLMPASFVEPKVFYAGTIGFPGMQPIFWAAMILNLLMISDARMFASKGFRWLLEKLQPLQSILPKIVYFVLGGTVIFILINWLSRNSIIDLSNIPFNLKRSDAFSELPYYKKVIMEFVPLTFALTPVVLFALLWAWIAGFFDQIRLKTFSFVLSSFFLIFMAAVIQEGLLVTVRYSIILFPLAIVLASIAIGEFFIGTLPVHRRRILATFSAVASTVVILYAANLIQLNYYAGSQKAAFVDKVFRSGQGILFTLVLIGMGSYVLYHFMPWKKIVALHLRWVFALFVAFSVVSIYLISPFYFSYTNELLPKTYIINGAWGYGGYEAAQYMNSLPDAKNLKLWTDAYGVCEFFVGKCIHKAKVDTQKYTIDYYFQSLQATVPLNFPHPMESQAVWSLHIDDRSKSFLKINKAKPAVGSNSPDISNNGTDNEQ